MTINIKPLYLILFSAILAMAILTTGILLILNVESSSTYWTVEQRVIDATFKSLCKLAKEKALRPPVPFQYVNSDFGLRKNPVRKFIGGLYRNQHLGIDLPATNDQPIYGSAVGTVIKIGKSFVGGRYVFIDYGNDLVAKYYHLNKILVRPFQKVHGYSIIGLAGKTGVSTGIHLHHQIEYKGVPVNPLFWYAGER